MMIVSYVIMCFIFGTTFLLIKTGLHLGWSPFLFSSLRFIIAGFILLLFVSFKSKGSIPFKQHLQILIISLLMTTIPFGALYYAEQSIPSGIAAILTSLSPLFILTLNFLLNGQRIFIRQLAGVILCILGVTLIVSLDGTLAGHSVWPKIVIIGAEAVFAYGTIRSKTMIEKNVDPFMFNALQMLYGGVLLFLMGLLTKETFTIPHVISGYFILLYFIFVASILANSLFFWLIKKTNPFFPSTWTYVSPLIAMILGSLLLHEQFGIRGVLGAIFVIFGVVLANLVTKHKQEKRVHTVIQSQSIQNNKVISHK